VALVYSGLEPQFLAPVCCFTVHLEKILTRNKLGCDVDNEFSVVAAIINIDEAQAQASMPVLIRLN